MKGALGYGRYDDDPKHIGCPRARTDMTPCVARDGDTATDEGGECVGCDAKPADLLKELVELTTKGLDGNLVAHAKRELELLGEDEGVIEWMIRTVAAFASYGHSGGSASVCIPMLNDLLRFENLTPLTDDPKEWIQHTPEVFPPDGVWQNSRNGAAFSNDGGKTYYLLTEGGNDTNRTPLHTSMAKEIQQLLSEEKIKACGPTEDLAVCACGCSGYDERCPLYLQHYRGTTQVPESHICCKIPGRTNAAVSKET